MFTLYNNTDENAEAVGWIRVPEYCVIGSYREGRGYASAKFVLHDERRGMFIFLNAEDAKVNNKG